MRLSGEATLHAPIERVWQALGDPAVLARAVPGCERLEATGPGEYRITVTIRAASAEGSCSGTVEVHERRWPSAFALRVCSAGAPGTITGDVRGRLSEVDGATSVSYDAGVTVGGPLGAIGQRLLAGFARRSADEFLAAVDDVVTGNAAPVSPEEAPTRASLPSGALLAVAVGFVLGALWGRRGR